jgi:hypothetical protein
LKSEPAGRRRSVSLSSNFKGRFAAQNSKRFSGIGSGNCPKPGL